MDVLIARDITKAFPGVVALNRVSLTIQPGRIHCIIGENGAGKSTLIKILTGISPVDEGEVFIEGKKVDYFNKKDREHFNKIAYVPQELDLFGEMSVAENIFMPYEKNGIKRIVNKKDLQIKALTWIERFKIMANPGDMVKNISVSDRQLIQIARSMTNINAKILMLDEPTTSLTTAEVERLFVVLRELKTQGKAIIFISHKLEEIFAIGDELTVLRNGVKVTGAEVKDVDIPWVISRMVGSEIDQKETYKSEKAADEVLMEVKGLCGAKFNNIDFTLHKGEILGFSGLVGSGRTEIMQAILGYLPLWAGEVLIEGKHWNCGSTTRSAASGFIYMPEERKQQGILPDLPVKQNITVSLLNKVKRMFLISTKAENQLTAEVIQTYEIKTASYDQHIRFLSGGNQQKVIIGRAMFASPKILVFDEPTKGIDVGSKIEIYKLMKRLAEEEQIGVILISSEMNEVLRCSNRVITVYFGEKVGEFSAPFDKTRIMNAIMGIQGAE
jgi:ribose transport system ATP-binding protein